MAARGIDDILAESGLDDVQGPYALYRQDTHGLEYFMRGGLSEAAANYLAKHYNDLGHHQAYWAKIPETPTLEILPPR